MFKDLSIPEIREKAKIFREIYKSDFELLFDEEFVHFHAVSKTLLKKITLEISKILRSTDLSTAFFECRYRVEVKIWNDEI